MTYRDFTLDEGENSETGDKIQAIVRKSDNQYLRLDIVDQLITLAERDPVSFNRICDEIEQRVARGQGFIR